MMKDNFPQRHDRHFLTENNYQISKKVHNGAINEKTEVSI